MVAVLQGFGVRFGAKCGWEVLAELFVIEKWGAWWRGFACLLRVECVHFGPPN